MSDDYKEAMEMLRKIDGSIERRRRAGDDFEERLKRVESMVKDFTENFAAKSDKSFRVAVVCSMGLGSLVSALVTLLLNLAFGR
jgi:hypothetical protein